MALDYTKRAFDDVIADAGFGSDTARIVGGTKRNFADSVSQATGGQYGNALGVFEDVKRLEDAFETGLKSLSQPTWELQRAMAKGRNGSPWTAGEVEALAMGVARNIEDLIEANNQSALTKLLKDKALKNMATALGSQKAADMFEETIRRLGANREWGRRVAGGSDTAMRQAAIRDAGMEGEDAVTRVLDRVETSGNQFSLPGLVNDVAVKPIARTAKDIYQRLRYPGVYDEEVNRALIPLIGKPMTEGNLNEVIRRVEARMAEKGLIPPAQPAAVAAPPPAPRRGPRGPRGNPPGTTSSASATGTGIVAGGVLGAMAPADDENEQFINALFTAAGVGTAAGVASKLSKGGKPPPASAKGSTPKPPKGPPAPVSSTPKPPPVKNGFGGNPEAIGAGLGTVFAPDADGDGEVSFGERAGAAITGGVMGRGARAIGNRLGGAPKAPPAGKFRGPNNQTFAGVNAKTADKAALARAQNMEAEGASRDDIWDATGWFKGVDGKWRFEIDDSGASFAPLPRTPYMTELANQYARENFGVDSVIYLPSKDVRRAEAIQWATNESRKLNDAAKTQTAPLSERLNHPQLNSAYDLSGVKVGRETNQKLHGSYEPTSKMLRVADESPVLGQKHDPRETALHETQHHVQSVEDFARGGNPDAEAALMRDSSKKIAAIQTQIKSLLDGADRNTYDMWNELMLARVNGDNVRAGDINDMLAASGDTGRKLSDLLWESALLKSRTGNEADAFDAYRRLAGETEARNVQTRRDFTPEQRRAKRPWETQDVPDDQQIVRFAGGKAESRPKPPPAGNRLGKPKPPPAKGAPKPKPVEARRAAPRGNNPFRDPRLTPGENKTAEMVLNGYSYDEIADEMMTSRDVVKTQASAAQRKLGTDVQLPRPGGGKRPAGSTKREAAFELFDSGVGNAQIAERLGISVGNVRTYRSYWKQRQSAPVANVNGALYNPPSMPERPFEADYPQNDWPDGPPVDAQGRLTQDMDRKPLDPNSVVIGRNKAPGYGAGSEADRSLRDRIAIIQTLKQGGSRLEMEGRPKNQASGGWAPDFDVNGRFTGRGSAKIADDLDRPIMGLDDQEVIVLSHELAHSIDFKGGPKALRARNMADFNDRKWGIDHTGHRPEARAELESQLERIYTDLNNPVDGPVEIRSPKDHGYQAIDADRELWAEAIRAYMYDPNYIKTVAPEVAFMIRDHVNRSKSLRKTIQFNAAPTIVGLGGLGLGAAALSAQPAEAQKR
jgi:DNA-binding CsgD family transcriptional regulator